MKMRHDWKKIVRHAWSIRWLAAAGVFSAAEAALPLIQGVLAIPAGLFAALSAVAVGGAFVSRLIAQSQFGGND